MSRVQLALNVSDIEEAVAFYSRLFGIGPAKRRPGYANFAIPDPPLKLVLMENEHGRTEGLAGALNHLGVEVRTSDDVATAAALLDDAGIATKMEDNTIVLLRRPGQGLGARSGRCALGGLCGPFRRPGRVRCRRRSLVLYTRASGMRSRLNGHGTIR